ncbi:DNA-binding protein [Bordetella pertussis]|nr:DNA-binding protein [Bordetella pertussis]
MEYLFTLKYQLADADSDLDALVERLGEAGCDDALVGMGLPGRLVLEFTREADSAEAAVRSALADVRRAMPTAALIEAAPDLVGLTDVAQTLGRRRPRRPGGMTCRLWPGGRALAGRARRRAR